MGLSLNPIGDWLNLWQNQEKDKQAQQLQGAQLRLQKQLLDQAAEQQAQNTATWDQTENSIFGSPDPGYRGDGVGGEVPPPGSAAYGESSGDYSGIDNPTGGPGSNFSYTGGNTRTGGWTGDAGVHQYQPDTTAKDVGFDARRALAPNFSGGDPASPWNTGETKAQAGARRDLNNALAREPPSTAGSLTDVYDWANQSDKAALQDFSNKLAAYKDVQGPDYTADIESQGAKAYADPNDVARQTQALDMLKARTGVEETGEERLLRFNARQKQEQQQKSDLAALRNELRSRGMYGSGAELAGALGSAQNTGMQRTASELGAQANAMQRAMAALQAYNTGSATARGQSAQEAQFRGNAADVVAKANKQSRDDVNLARAQTELANNDQRLKRDTVQLDARMNADARVGDRAQNTADTHIRVAAGKTGTAQGDFDRVSSANSNLVGGIGDRGNYLLTRPNRQLPGSGL